MRSFVANLCTTAFLCWAFSAEGQPATGVPPPGQQAAGFDAEAIKAAVNDHVRAKIDEGGGVYRLVDTRTGEKLDLEFVDVALVGAANVSQVHNPVRPAEGGVYFACANFRPLGALKNGPRESLYDIDLSLEPRNGVLEVTEVFVHKEPRLVNGKWVRVPRAAQ